MFLSAQLLVLFPLLRKLDVLFLQKHLLLLVLELERVQINNQLGVLLRFEGVVRANPQLNLLLLLLQLADGLLHVVQLPIEFFDGLSVAPLALLLIRYVAHHVVLVQLHQAVQVVVFVHFVDYFLHILRKLQNYRLFLARARLLLHNFRIQLVRFALISTQFVGKATHFATLVLKVVFKLKQLVLETVDLFLLGPYFLLHFLRAVTQHMLALLQVLNLELVLVEVRFPLVQFFNFFFLRLLLVLNFVAASFGHLRNILLLGQCLSVRLMRIFDCLFGQITLALLLEFQLLHFGLFAHFDVFLVEVVLLQIENLLFVRLLLQLVLVIIVVNQVFGVFLRLHKLLLHLGQVLFELAHQLPDRALVLPLYLLYLSFKALLHFEAFLLQLEIAVPLHFQLAFKQLLNFFDRPIILLLNLAHRLSILLLLHFLLRAQVVVSLLQILNVNLFLPLALLKLSLIRLLVLLQLGIDLAFRALQL